MDEYYFDVKGETDDGKVFVLIIYDIIDNKQRVKLAKFLQGYGFRIQKSAFEAVITKKKYHKLLEEIKQFITSKDSVKIYKIIGKGQVTSYGIQTDNNVEEIIII